MVDLSLPRCDLLALPPELLQEICQFLDKKSLKGMRVTSKLCNKLSAPLLFQTFTLYPHLRSFEYLTNISKTPNIARFVERVRYDTTYLGITHMIVMRLKSVHSALISEAQKKAAIARALELDNQSINADAHMDNIAQMSYMEHAFADLPNLRSIWLSDVGGPIFAGMASGPGPWLPSFYAQMVGETCDQSEHTRLEFGTIGSPRCFGTYVHAVLMSLHRIPCCIDRLDIQNLRWNPVMQQVDFSKHSAVFLKNALSGVKKFRLTPSVQQTVFSPFGTMTNLQVLLRAMPELETLRLAFRHMDYFDASGPDMLNMATGTKHQSYFHGRTGTANELGEVPAQLNWSPNLRSLTLTGLTCTSKEFQSVLKHCSESLRFLVLADLVLMPETEDGPRACLVGLFKWIQKHLELEDFNITEFMTNGGMQSWMIQRQENCRLKRPDLLLPRVRDFVVRGGSCPLQNVAIVPGYYDVHKKSYNAKAPDVLKGAEYEGDETWQMTYKDDYEETEDEDEDEDDGFPFTDDEDLSDEPWGFGIDFDDEDLSGEDSLDSLDMSPYHAHSGLQTPLPPTVPLAQLDNPSAPAAHNQAADLFQTVDEDGSLDHVSQYS